MRLLNTSSLQLEDFQASSIPEYVVLSHKWEDGEVTLQNLQNGRAPMMKGYAKLEGCCRKAASDGFTYIWVDTCCIDKTSSAELSETINSMYQWYKNSRICYAYLSDFTMTSTSFPSTSKSSDEENFAKCRWWTRGWTLQELIAPITVEFYDSNWEEYGTKVSLHKQITKITGIDEGILRGEAVKSRNVAVRMSWAAKRSTTRVEDQAYCLLGIFGVHMPLLYGEGERAFVRLQEEIMRVCEDYTLFTWFGGNIEWRPSKGLLANSQADFLDPTANSHQKAFWSYSKLSKNCWSLFTPPSGHQVPFRNSRGLRITLPMLQKKEAKGEFYACITLLHEKNDMGSMVCVNLTCLRSEVFVRPTGPDLVLLPVSGTKGFKYQTIWVTQPPPTHQLAKAVLVSGHPTWRALCLLLVKPTWSPECPMQCLFSTWYNMADLLDLKFTPQSPKTAESTTPPVEDRKGASSWQGFANIAEALTTLHQRQNPNTTLTVSDISALALDVEPSQCWFPYVGSTDYRASEVRGVFGFASKEFPDQAFLVLVSLLNGKVACGFVHSTVHTLVHEERWELWNKEILQQATLINDRIVMPMKLQRACGKMFDVEVAIAVRRVATAENGVRRFVLSVTQKAVENGKENYKFFRDACELVYKEDGIRQGVIHELASEGGLGRIRELLHAVGLTEGLGLGPLSLQDNEGKEETGSSDGNLLKAAEMMFMEVIRHSQALSSGLLKEDIKKIYNAVYGQQGQQAIKLYKVISASASAMSFGELETAFAVLAKLLDLNPDDTHLRPLKDYVLSLESAVHSAKDDESRLVHLYALKWIENCKRSLGMTTSNRHSSNESAQASFLKLNIDGPGKLSLSGPRHDNDFSDIQHVRIFPTYQEITSERPSYLPSLDPSKLHLKGIDGLLDRQFRLYREDSIGGIRDAIQADLDQDAHPLRGGRGDGSTRMNWYGGLSLDRLRCDRFEGLVITISVNQPAATRSLYPVRREAWWTDNKRLRTNSLVCLLDQSNSGQAVFCVVVEIREQHSRGQRRDNDKPQWQDFSANKAIVTVAPVDKKDVSFVSGYFSSHKNSTKMRLYEFPDILIQSFQPTLTALQSRIEKHDMPFADLIASSDGMYRKATVHPPQYCQQRDFHFQLRSLMSDGKDLSLSLTDPFDLSELIRRSTLDEKQAESVHALTRRLALCQGPPGTGKSFTSVALLRVLLETKIESDLGPILIVTYTNHALDQTLENCLDKGIRNVIRIGSESKSDRLEAHNIRNISARAGKTDLEKSAGETLEKSLNEVTALVNQAIMKLSTSPEQFIRTMNKFWSTKEIFDARQEVDLRCLAHASIIGMTTAGLARNFELLKCLPIKVVLVEEAGEVLEAHTLTAFLPSVEHAIMIGDHLQLKPSTNNYDLTSESQYGKTYSLDISMFERLVHPLQKSPGVSLPYDTLETQRRMNPLFSALIRQTLCPNLKDADNVKVYPPVAGMKESVYWLDHSVPEAGSEGTSKSNDFEVSLTVCLVAHLMAQGVHEPKDIAIITPYLGQFMKLRRSLSEVFEVALNERDQALLEDAGMFESCEQNKFRRFEKTSLLSTLKLATIDNFRGEEAKVVIVSLVRSNKQRNCGFLKTPNRINVLLSRAKHGMYLIGNSKTSVAVPMWSKALDIFKKQGNIGETLRLSCSRHPEALMEASTAQDFHRLSPEGGCNLPCGQLLRCGHPCEQICHSQLRHDSVFCDKACGRTKEHCKHQCQNYCGDPCDPRCEEPVEGVNMTLPCGHARTNARCWETQCPREIMCDKAVLKRAVRCGHMVKVKCDQQVDEDFTDCDADCGEKLKCGHLCNVKCWACPMWGENERIHLSPCMQCNP